MVVTREDENMDAHASLDSARHRMLRGARFALHVITVVLAFVGTIRAIDAGAEIVVASIAAALFLGWYATGAALLQGTVARWWLFALAALWAGLLAISAEYVWLAFPLLLLAGHVLRAGWSVVFAILVLAAAIMAPLLHHGQTSFAHIVGPVVGGGFALAISLGYDTLLRDAAERERLIASLVRAHEETAELQDELLRTQREAGASRERTRLARDLHDTIAQELSSISLLARTGEIERMPQIDALSQKSLTELRRIVAALDPTELEGSALAGALERMLAEAHAHSGIQTSLEVDLPPRALPTAVEVTLLRVAQSALANVRQHAAATTVAVRLHESEGSVGLDVIDDGSGFDPDAGDQPRAERTSYGLAAMRARVREQGGELHVQSGVGEGTRLRVRIPLPGADTFGDGRDA